MGDTGALSSLDQVVIKDRAEEGSEGNRCTLISLAQCQPLDQTLLSSLASAQDVMPFSSPVPIGKIPFYGQLVRYSLESESRELMLLVLAIVPDGERGGDDTIRDSGYFRGVGGSTCLK